MNPPRTDTAPRRATFAAPGPIDDATVNLWAATRPVGWSAWLGATAIDAATLALGPILALALAGSAGWPAALALAVAVMVVQAVVLARTGQTLGCRLMRIRVVDARTASPIGTRLLRTRVRAASLRDGRDPMSAIAAPGGTIPRRVPAPARTSTPVAHLDTGQSRRVMGGIVIGRNPVAVDPADSTWDVLDISRTMADSHLRLVWDGRVLWATDLDSPHGSWVWAEEWEQLPPQQPRPLANETMVRLGERRMVVRGLGGHSDG